VLRNLPKSRYAGLTIIMSNGSRFDKIYLLSGEAGILLNEFLFPELNYMMCDIRVMEDESPFLLETKCVLLLGEAAMLKWAPETVGNVLNEMRGSPLVCKGLPAIASYFPQDCCDPKNHEANLNEDSKNYTGDDSLLEGDEEDEGDVKRFSKTKRSNYAFWLRKDIQKVKLLLRDFKYNLEGPTYRNYPSAEDAIEVLTNTKVKYFYFDMETDYEEQNLLCFSFSFDGRTIYNVPVLDNNYKPAYTSIPQIIRALAIAIRDNIIVAHNGACFDFFVLGFKYNIPVRKCYDTMLAQHRCYPDVEKSLGHCVSLWTWEKFHKDSDSRSYQTREHMTQKMKYCGKDVYTMYLVHQAIEKHASKTPGLRESIDLANQCIVPYLCATIQGMMYSEQERAAIVKEADRRMMQYVRIIKILIGEEGMHEVRGGKREGQVSLMPGSSTQCVQYFHTILEYPVLFTSPKTGKPGLGAKLMYRLALKYPENPVFMFILAFRAYKEEHKKLKFIPWRNDDGSVFEPPVENKPHEMFPQLVD